MTKSILLILSLSLVGSAIAAESNSRKREILNPTILKQAEQINESTGQNNLGSLRVSPSHTLIFERNKSNRVSDSVSSEVTSEYTEKQRDYKLKKKTKGKILFRDTTAEGFEMLWVTFDSENCDYPVMKDPATGESLEGEELKKALKACSFRFGKPVHKRGSRPVSQSKSSTYYVLYGLPKDNSFKGVEPTVYARKFIFKKRLERKYSDLSSYETVSTGKYVYLTYWHNESISSEKDKKKYKGFE